MVTLKNIRAEIVDTQSEISRIQAALPPLDTRLAEVAPFLRQIEQPFIAFVDRLAVVLATSDDIGISLHNIVDMNDAGKLTSVALGAAVAHNRERLVKTISERVTALDQCPNRLPAAERKTQLEGLFRKLYALEFEEETMLDGAQRRPDCNAAAAMGIPLEVAQKHNFFVGQ